MAAAAAARNRNEFRVIPFGVSDNMKKEFSVLHWRHTRNKSYLISVAIVLLIRNESEQFGPRQFTVDWVSVIVCRSAVKLSVSLVVSNWSRHLSRKFVVHLLKIWCGTCNLKWYYLHTLLSGNTFCELHIVCDDIFAVAVQFTPAYEFPFGIDTAVVVQNVK